MADEDKARAGWQVQLPSDWVFAIRSRAAFNERLFRLDCDSN